MKFVVIVTRLNPDKKPVTVHDVTIECEDAAMTQALGQLMSFVGYKEETKHESSITRSSIRDAVSDVLFGAFGHAKPDEPIPTSGDAQLYGDGSPVGEPKQPDSRADNPKGV